MKQAIDKLINEYESKIRDCDIKIDALSVANKKYRQGLISHGTLCDSISERKVWEAKRQCLLQATKDIDSLRDNC